ncbi:MAG: cupin domain-containing protein [Candidatus Aminicenantes bacterium]|nr:cupin domain-containing protein [Candidatus Aminicenantes bacterium]
MKNYMEEWEGTAYPEMVRDLPEIDVPLEGVRGWLLQSKDKQVAFFDIEPVGKVPPHSHCAQWGFVVEGEMSLTIGEKTTVHRKGDWYYIPEGVVHSATFLTRVNAIDIFDDPARYKVKER